MQHILQDACQQSPLRHATEIVVSNPIQASALACFTANHANLVHGPHQQVVTGLYTTLPIASVPATERAYSTSMPAQHSRHQPIQGAFMNKQITTIRTASPSRGRRMIIASATAALVGTLSLVGISHADETKTPQAATQQKTQQHAGKHARMTPEQAEKWAEKRTDRMINRLVPDGTPEQKAKLATIAKATFSELHPLKQKIRAARVENMKLLSQPTIDRNALEQSRQTQQQLADQRSRLITKAYADAAEVLTPAQRVEVAKKLAKKRHHFRHGHGNRHHQNHAKDGAAAPAAKPAQ
jgi:Spy/CpxP family protein refolding chaperone